MNDNRIDLNHHNSQVDAYRGRRKLRDHQRARSCGNMRLFRRSRSGSTDRRRRREQFETKDDRERPRSVSRSRVCRLLSPFTCILKLADDHEANNKKYAESDVTEAMQHSWMDLVYKDDDSYPEKNMVERSPSQRSGQTQVTNTSSSASPADVEDSRPVRPVERTLIFYRPTSLLLSAKDSLCDIRSIQDLDEEHTDNLKPDDALRNGSALDEVDETEHGRTVEVAFGSKDEEQTCDVSIPEAIVKSDSREEINRTEENTAIDNKEGSRCGHASLVEHLVNRVDGAQVSLFQDVQVRDIHPSNNGVDEKECQGVEQDQQCVSIGNLHDEPEQQYIELESGDEQDSSEGCEQSLQDDLDNRKPTWFGGLHYLMDSLSFSESQVCAWDGLSDPFDEVQEEHNFLLNCSQMCHVDSIADFYELDDGCKVEPDEALIEPPELPTVSLEDLHVQLLHHEEKEKRKKSKETPFVPPEFVEFCKIDSLEEIYKVVISRSVAPILEDRDRVEVECEAVKKKG